MGSEREAGTQEGEVGGEDCGPPDPYPTLVVDITAYVTWSWGVTSHFGEQKGGRKVVLLLFHKQCEEG